MALAFGTFHELSHQLRFLLFEIGIGLPAASVDYFITLAHRNALKMLQNAAINEGLVANPIASHHVHDFIDQLQNKLKKTGTESHFYQWTSLRNELDESIANDALAQAYKHHWNNQLKMEISPWSSLWSWLQQQSIHDSLIFLEQWGSLHHPTHPMFKAKMGYSRRDVLQNAPEFQARLSLHWGALAKNHSIISSDSAGFTGFMMQQFPKEFADWRNRLQCMHCDPEQYYPIPIHPWQWRNRLQKHCNSLLDAKHLLLLPHHQLCRPSLSEQMMIPSVSSQTLIQTDFNDNDNSPKLDAILNQTDHYYQSLFVSQKLGSIQAKFEPIVGKEWLTASVLQNTTDIAKENQFIIPLAALFASSPITNKPLLVEIITASGQNPETYFREYCYKLLFSQLHLLLKHGLALDVFSEDTLLILDNNKTRAVHFRRLQIVETQNDLSSIELARIFIRTHLQNNISHWVTTLAEEYHLSYSQLWNSVTEVIRSLFDMLSKEIDAMTLKDYENCLLKQPWQYSSSIIACLQGNRQIPKYFLGVNPLNS